jgi:hypothetical protein
MENKTVEYGNKNIETLEPNMTRMGTKLGQRNKSSRIPPTRKREVLE